MDSKAAKQWVQFLAQAHKATLMRPMCVEISNHWQWAGRFSAWRACWLQVGGCVCVCSDLHMCVFEHSRLFGVAGLVRDGFVPAAAWFGWVWVG